MSISSDINAPRAESVAARPEVAPAVDIFENDDELIVYADLPGVKPEDVQIDLDQGKLTILGKRVGRGPEGAALLFGTEPEFDYKRVFTVSDGIDAERISASYDDGVLTLVLPRHERTKPRRIQVQRRG